MPGSEVRFSTPPPVVRFIKIFVVTSEVFDVYFNIVFMDTVGMIGE